MPEVKAIFSPSINIERDYAKNLDYIVTTNACQVYDQLVRNRDSGIHSFTIIGSYGTGKSAFLVALRKHFIDKKTTLFEPLNGHFQGIEEFRFDFIVGNYGSLQASLASYFELGEESTNKEILTFIRQRHEEFKKRNIFWFLVIDEFGKHLEYAAKENPEKELYFVQQLSEFANEQEKNFYFITTLHQAFDSYANGLTLQQRKEWDKVKGRLKELTFNEPVEQLLYIASEYLKNNKSVKERGQLEQLVKCIENARVFPLKNELNLHLAENLYPLDPLSASVLALALQKYGQNERSLFTFLQSEEFLGINDFDQNSHPFFNLSCVYDYLIHNHHHFLSSKYNAHYLQWNALKRTLERVESDFKGDIYSAQKLVKAIGLLNIFAAEGAKIDHKFFLDYASVAMGVDDVEMVLNQLQKRQIIRYRSYKQQFIVFEGTDVDIEFELQNATNKVDPVTNVVSKLKQYFDFPYLPAKRIYYERGTPRFFEFKLSDKPITKAPKQPIDGYINLVFDIEIEDLLKNTKGLQAPILYGVFNSTDKIKAQLFLIQRIQYLIEEVVETTDRVAQRELKDMLQFQIDKLNDLVLENVYAGKGDIDWVFKGKNQLINNAKSLNNTLSAICEEIYTKTPEFKNELVNKESVSPAIYRPRKELLKLLIRHSKEEHLGFDPNTFPAEKTIYLSLLEKTKIHRKRNGQWSLGAPEENSGIDELWKASEDFFESTKTGKRSIVDFIDILKKPPFGLKKGFIESWIPIYLIIKKDDFALFQEGAYVTELNYDIANLIYRNPKLFEIKAFHISEIKQKVFARYRALLKKDESVEFSNESFVETVTPFLLIYNDLNQYGRKTNKISAPAQKLRDAIKSATDPEQAFFEQFVSALGYADISDLVSDKVFKKFAYDLDKCVEEIKSSYEWLIDRVEHCLLDVLDLEGKDYSKYKEVIKERYATINDYKLVPYQKKLLGRLLSDQPSREKWIEAVAFAILDKPLSILDDEEEPLLLDRLSTRIEELDNIRELNNLNINLEENEVFKLKLQPFSKQPLDLNVVVNKKKVDNESDRLEKLKDLLTDNKDLNMALLLKLIEEQNS